MKDPKLTGWDVALPGADGTVIMIYDPWKDELKEVARWVDAKTYCNPDALAKGILGRIEGPVVYHKTPETL